ncbi:hypothetical protein HRR83_005837 [Exophiala dermatitidis]|nr:hypothetical protein HRR73_007414 [Exophiala dermatitidis]KAJ4513394.1 hypothetical protein HRR74_006206 [Exophiala dermatitidis]KAJ4538053.1 hypothetical protein HRR77_007094 [Exophiala dermatitidis]KAJ4539784.1 hypothetical protein HRR76_003221 [Exophiala dermatitidis]KAJ4547134.1 hypothetical protein HRR78_005234 [Exophiala dermatitidis]
MYGRFVAGVCLVAGALAAPCCAQTLETLDYISANASLPKVIVFGPLSATLMSASNWSAVDNINYGKGVGPTFPELVANVSEVLQVAQLSYIAMSSPSGSSNINSSTFLNVSQIANRLLCAEGSDIAGAVMIHGTNTLVETAFGVDLTLQCDKPFIVTAAMRPNTYVSPDGRANFYQAVAAAVSPDTVGRGGLIALNDRLTSIFYSTKLDANTPDTFKALEQGNVGVFLAGQPYYYFDAALPTGRPYFDITNTTTLPSVITLYGHQGFDASLMYAAVANGAKGLVILGAGAASLSTTATTAAADLYAQGIPVVAAPRPITGAGVPGISPGTVIKSGYVGGDQARIMLQLAINAGYSLDQIRDLFEGPLRNAIYGPYANQLFYGLVPNPDGIF